MAQTLVKQRDLTDCGAACLASVAAKYKLNIPVAKIRQFAGTDQMGTNMLGLVEAATKLGFEAKGVKGTLNSLNKIPLPAIAHLIVDAQLHHYVVIYKISKKHVTLMDPADGKMHAKTISDFQKEWSGVLLLLLPAENFKKEGTKVSHTAKFWQLIKPHKKIILQALFGAVVYTILGLSTSIFIQKLTDHVLVDENYNLLNLMSLAMIVILFFQSFISIIKSIFIIRTGQHIDAQLILGYYKHLLKLPQQFFDTMRVGEIISRINDAVKIRAFINDTAINLIVNLLIIIFSFVLMFTYYWKLALLTLTLIPLYIVIYIITNSINKTVQRKMMEESANLESQLVESLSAVGTIKRFGLEEFHGTKTETLFIKLLRTVYTANKSSIYSGNLVELISKLMTIILMWNGSKSVLANEITTGELFSFYTLIAYFTNPISSLIGANKIFQDAIIAADRLFEIMDLEIEEDRAKMILPKAKIGDIHFKNVGFSYGTRKTVFENLNLQIKAGSFTAIVGESGSGKSTLMNLLQQLYPIKNGNICIGKYDLSHLKNSALRKTLSVVPQNIDLFAGNVIDNIAVGDYEPNMQYIIESCTQLGIIDFITALPNGFQTYLGENGITLSGGQKQRIAIARALYQKPEILILDEATSSLDPKAERYVKNTIDLLIAQQKTIILIAHRLTSVQHADHIIVLDKGLVVEEGKHHEMMQNKSHYHNLWHQQFG